MKLPPAELTRDDTDEELSIDHLNNMLYQKIVERTRIAQDQQREAFMVNNHSTDKQTDRAACWRLPPVSLLVPRLPLSLHLLSSHLFLSLSSPSLVTSLFSFAFSRPLSLPLFRCLAHQLQASPLMPSRTASSTLAWCCQIATLPASLGQCQAHTQPHT